MRLSFMIPIAVALFVSQSAVAQQPATPVVFGWAYSPDVPQVAQAYDKDLWKSENLEPKMIPFATGRDAFEALIGGQLDMAIMAEFPPVSGALRNLKFSILATLSKYNAMRVIAKSATPITSLGQLAGKKIGTPVGTNVHFDIADALKSQNVRAEFVNVGPADLIPALLRGDIDAASMFPSAYGNARRALGAQYQEMLLPNVGEAFILVGSDKFAKEQPDVIKRFLAVLLKGEALVVSDPKDSQEVTSRYVKGALPVEQVQAIWPDYSFKITLDNGTFDLMAREGQWVRDMGYVKEGDPSRALYEGFVVKGPLQSLAPDRVTLD
jgi:NitT/TauT family transport system substrate-binding protein